MEITKIEIAKLELKKDDVLYINVKDDCSERELHSFYKSVKKILPENITILLVNNDMKLSVITKKEARELK